MLRKLGGVVLFLNREKKFGTCIRKYQKLEKSCKWMSIFYFPAQIPQGRWAVAKIDSPNILFKGNERLYPAGEVDPIPDWVQEMVIKPIEDAGIVEKVSSLSINQYSIQ